MQQTSNPPNFFVARKRLEERKKVINLHRAIRNLSQILLIAAPVFYSARKSYPSALHERMLIDKRDVKRSKKEKENGTKRNEEDKLTKKRMKKQTNNVCEGKTLYTIFLNDSTNQTWSFYMHETLMILRKPHDR